MTTIPIEVIVQDAEAPVVPGEDGTNNTETNITVPDTGTISSSGDTSSSASSIILPAILLVLAIGTIVAILIHKYHKQKKDKTTRKERLAVATSSTIAILAAAVLVGNLVMPATKAATSVEPGAAELDTVDKITITATREIDSDITVVTVKNTSYATANLDFGYKVTAAMAENATTANLYLDGDETSEYYIAPVSDGTLADNTWGYTLEEPSEDTAYLPMPLVDTPATITKGHDMAEDKVVDIYYAIKVDKDMPAGTYAGEIEYNISPAVEYMQDFAAMTEEEKTATLTNMPEGGQYILKDIRDEKPYYISKLADGNVWMTQNLDLDLKTDGSIVYDSTNTNLTVAGSGAYENGYTTQDGVITWTPVNATINFSGSSVEGWSNSDTVPYVANPGDVYYYTSGNDEADTIYNSLELCMEDHSEVDCKHYHAGNYYNWSAAVASNDSSSLTTQYDNAANSICPAGWRLQDGPAINDRAYSDLANLAKSINVLENNIHEACGGTCNYYDYLAGGFISIRTGSAWLVRSGDVGEGALLERAGNYAGYWTRTNNGDNLGFRLSFSSSRFTPAAGSLKNQGFSIRCLAR